MKTLIKKTAINNVTEKLSLSICLQLISRDNLGKKALFILQKMKENCNRHVEKFQFVIQKLI